MHSCCSILFSESTVNDRVYLHHSNIQSYCLLASLLMQYVFILVLFFPCAAAILISRLFYVRFFEPVLKTFDCRRISVLFRIKLRTHAVCWLCDFNWKKTFTRVLSVEYDRPNIRSKTIHDSRFSDKIIWSIKSCITEHRCFMLRTVCALIS